MPGRRPQGVGEDVGRKVIADNPRSNLTAKMVDALLSTWISTVTSSFEREIMNGKSKDYAYITALAKFDLSGCAHIFFRLSDENFTEDHILAICAGVDVLITEQKKTSDEAKSSDALKLTEEKLDEARKKHVKELKEKNLEIKHQAAKIQFLTNELTKTEEKITNMTTENQKIAILQQSLAQEAKKVNRLTTEKEYLTSQVSKFQDICTKNREQIQELEDETARALAEAEKLRYELEEACKAKVELTNRTYRDTVEELRPIDMEEFTEYLSYNFKSIGLDSSKPYFHLLLDFLADVLFQNKPIICNQAIGHTIAKCVSNTLCGNSFPLVIPYHNAITNDEILTLLESDNRVIVLDGFIGIYDEMELLPLLKRIKRKIIFATAVYDKTMAYFLPEEVLCYCTYLNADKISALFLMNELEEDPSTILEQVVLPNFEEADSYVQRLCTEIMHQLGFTKMMSKVFSVQMTSERKFVEYLAFSVLPYAFEVFETSPYELSERLQKYAGPTGRCEQKDLLLEWFGNE